MLDIFIFINTHILLILININYKSQWEMWKWELSLIVIFQTILYIIYNSTLNNEMSIILNII